MPLSGADAHRLDRDLAVAIGVSGARDWGSAAGGRGLGDVCGRDGGELLESGDEDQDRGAGRERLRRSVAFALADAVTVEHGDVLGHRQAVDLDKADGAAAQRHGEGQACPDTIPSRPRIRMPMMFT